MDILNDFSEELSAIRDIREKSNDDILDALSQTYSLRHDVIHKCFSYYVLNAPHLMVERKIKYYLPKLFHTGNKTPDVPIFIRNGKLTRMYELADAVILLDFSVSGVGNQREAEKLQKYDDIVSEILQYYTMKAAVHIVNIKPDYSNLEVELMKLSNVVEGIEISLFPLMEVRMFLQELKRTQQELKSYIKDEKLVQAYLKEEFQNDVEVESFQCEPVPKRIDDMVEYYMTKKRKNDECRSIMNEVMLNQKDKIDHDDLFKKNVEIFRELLEDEEIITKYEEKKTETKKIDRSIQKCIKDMDNFPKGKVRPSHQLYTPQLMHNQNAVFTHRVLSRDKLRLEQNTILDILSAFENIRDDHMSFDFVRSIYKEMTDSLTGEYSELNISMFNKGLAKNEEYDKEWKEKYHKYREECKKNHTPTKSFIGFLKLSSESVPDENISRVYRQKMMKIPLINKSNEYMEWWKKSHSGYKKEKKARIDKVRHTCELDASDEVETFLELLTVRRSFKTKTIIDDVVLSKHGCDAKVLQDLKNIMTDEIRPIYNELRHYVGFEYLWRQGLAAEQLMHFNQFSLPSNTLSFFTTGVNNFLYIINNCYHDQGKDVGKAFMVVGYIDDDRWKNKMFGEMNFYKTNIKGITLFATGWRRIETFKVTFLRDQFYSVLSTSMNGLLRHKRDAIDSSRLVQTNSYNSETIKHHFSLKVLIALTSNQRIAEMLADMRYAIMASFSEFSEIEKLIIDKFPPPYTTAIEMWIFTRLHNLRRQASDFVEKNIRNIFFKHPTFYNGKRNEDSTGGKFEIPSIWDGTIITDLQDLLDDMFLYVHTLKEPSSIHHENVKAVNTILEYQEKYDDLNSKRKKGEMNNTELKEFLLSQNPIGHHKDILINSSHRTMKTLEGMDWESRFMDVFHEPVSEITSTKAAIPEYERELMEVKETKTDKLSKTMFIQEYAKYNAVKATPEVPKMLKTKISKESSLPNKNRSKVHDCILDVLEQNLTISTVFDMAEWNVLKNNSKTLADICIKAQYGAKREFYVINVGSKANARILENIFAEICKHIPNEMISVPGDKKMLVMQDFLNRALSKKGSKERVYFVNGDCTKWSAAETMECFMHLVEGMKEFIPDYVVKYLIMVIDMWANKQITIPISLLQNTFFTTETKTKYLKSHSAVLESTQNFLQGMFNYMSSFKAVCSSNYAMDVWKELYPDSNLRVDHLEHSDDYSLILTCENIVELRRFRALHRMIMKCHGFNDSLKKTNTQQFLMEFISLVSLNGHMTYPHIKKLKECGMNLGCTGYRDDMDSALSRVGEAVRIGAPLTPCYFMQKVHISNVARSYSLLPTERNNTHTLEDMFNMPVEVFGLPDTHPIFSLLCKGMSNNHRLLTYAGEKQISNVGSMEDETELSNVQYTTVYDILKSLYIRECEIMDDKVEANTLNEAKFNDGLRFYHPTYSFDLENNLIKKIRQKIKCTFDEAINFWDFHKSYNFIKPVDRTLLVQWMRSMYFRTTFTLAYSRNSRSQITMRISNFTASNCCVIGWTDELKPITCSIKELKLNLLNKSCELSSTRNTSYENDNLYTEILKTTLNCDATVTSIYSFFKDARVSLIGSHNRATVATLTPTKLNWLRIDNTPSTLLQFMFNNDDFIKDRRKNKGISSLFADMECIKKIYNVDLNEQTPLRIIKSVYTDIILSQNKRNLCMSYSSSIQTLEDFLRVHIEYGTTHYQRYSVVSSGITEAINPHSGQPYYKRLRTYTQDQHKVLIEDAALVYGLLKHAYKLEDLKIKQCLNNLSFKLANETGTIQNALEELINNNTLETVKQLGFNNNEMKIFAFLKAFLTDNVSDLLEITNTDLVYSYKYQSVPQELKHIFYECVRFDYQKCEYMALRFKKQTNQLLVVTKEPVKRLLTDSYLIAQKLFGLITTRELESSISQTGLRMLLKSKSTLTLSELTNQDERQQIKETLNISMELNYKKMPDGSIPGVLKFQYAEDLNSIFLYSEDNMNIDHSFTETINKRIRIRWEDSSIFMGNKKLFTVPLLSCSQSNCTYLDNDFELNGTSLNWWLKADRIRLLIHGDKLPISYDDYDKIVDFKMRQNRYKTIARAQRVAMFVSNIPTKNKVINTKQMLDDIERRIMRETVISKEESHRRDLVLNLNTMASPKPEAHTNNSEVISTEEHINEEQIPSQSMLGGDDTNQMNEDMLFELDNISLDGFEYQAPEEEEIKVSVVQGNDPGEFQFEFDMDMDDFEVCLDEDDNNETTDTVNNPQAEEEYSENDKEKISLQDISMTVDATGGMDNKELEDLLNFEMGEIDFGEVEFDIAADSGGDEDDVDVIRIREDSDRSSDRSSEKMITFNEYIAAAPKIDTMEIGFSTTESFTMRAIDKIGDPTQHIIDTQFIDYSVVNTLSNREKLGLLYRCKEVLQCSQVITDGELYTTMTVMMRMLTYFTDRSVSKITGDYVFAQHPGDDEYGIFLQYNGYLTEDQYEKIAMNGGFRKRNEDGSDHAYFIPISEERQLKLLDDCSTSFKLQKFANIKIIEECYFRLYSEPFVRLGFVNEILSELF